MSTPVYESSIETLENLDFEILCSGGPKGFGHSKTPCDQIAKYYYQHECGCSTYKCFDHHVHWQRETANIINKNHLARCNGCGNVRSPFTTVIRPL